MIYFFLPSVRHPFVGAVRVLRCFQGAVEEAISDAFSGKLHFRRKEEFYKKCTSKCRNQARQPTFASDKNRPGTTRVSEPGKSYKGRVTSYRKGSRHVRTTGVWVAGGRIGKVEKEITVRLEVLSDSRTNRERQGCLCLSEDIHII